VVSPYAPLFLSVYSVAGTILWVWMFYDAYKRRGGLDFWHWLFFFMPPSAAVYFIIHAKVIFSGRGGYFSASVKSKIKKVQQQIRISDTLAARAELGELFYQDGKYEECEAEFQRIFASEPQNMEALYYTGLCRMKRGDSAGALSFLQQVMDRDKKLRFGVAWLHYTECLVAVGRKDEALDERKKLARAFPRPMTEFAYAQLLHEMGQKDKAREILEDMIATCEHAPREDSTWLKQGRSLLRSVA
jgi:hypothetical protein